MQYEAKAAAETQKDGKKNHKTGHREGETALRMTRIREDKILLAENIQANATWWQRNETEKNGKES